MTDLDAWLDDYKPPIVTVSVCGRGDLLVAHARADAALAAARATDADMLASAETAEAKRVVEALEAEMEGSQQEFSFQGIGHQAWQGFKRQFPPTEQQRRDGMDCNLDRFAPAVISAASVDPKISPEQAARMATKLPEGEYEKLYEAVLQANGQVMGTPKSVLAAFIEQSRQNGGSSTTAAPEESPDQSSLAGNDDPSGESSETTTESLSEPKSPTTPSSSQKTTSPRSNGKPSKT